MPSHPGSLAEDQRRSLPSHRLQTGISCCLLPGAAPPGVIGSIGAVRRCPRQKSCECMEWFRSGANTGGAGHSLSASCPPPARFWGFCKPWAWESSWDIPKAEPPKVRGHRAQEPSEDPGRIGEQSMSPCSSSRAARTEPSGKKSSLLSAGIQIHGARAPFSPSCSRRFRFGLDSSEFTDRLLHFNSMAFPSWGRHISKYHIYQKACAKTRARITLLMVPPITTTTINFSGKKTRPGPFWGRVWEQGPALG